MLTSYKFPIYFLVNPNSQKMTRNEILALAIKSGNVRFDEQVCNNFDWKDFDDDKFEYYLKLAGISNNLKKEEILKNLKVLSNEGLTNAGVLFFAKKPGKYIISSKIRCIHFYGNERIDILDKKIIDRGIVGNIEFAIEYLMERVPVKYEIKALARNEFPEYPIEAYREAIVNAIIHFDYFLGDSIAIEKLRSKIVINNKGELLFSKKYFGRRSEARNRSLADLLSRTDFMEKAGTGIRRVKETCAKNGNKVSFDFSDAFWVEIESNNIDVTENVTEKRIKEILTLLNNNAKITTTEISIKLNVTRRTIARDIEKLKNKNIIKRIGSDKTGYWEIQTNHELH